MHSKPLILDGRDLSIEDVVEVARLRRRVIVPREIYAKMERSRRRLEDLLSKGETIYGVNTGVGALSETRLPPEDYGVAQRNIALSHAAGVGDPMPRDVVRAAMLIRVNTFVKGYSGVRPKIVEMLVEMLNRDLVPVVPRYGSVGASGDLAPLAHIALVLMGRGEAFLGPDRVRGDRALELAGLSPVELEEKEALSLINGTSASAAIAALNINDADFLLVVGTVAAALSCEALLCRSAPFSPKLNMVKRHVGQVEVSQLMSKMLKGSLLVDSVEKVQDAYSLRCVPQVHGAARDVLRAAREMVIREINSVSDNPLIMDGSVYSGCHFHGMHLAMAMDMVYMAVGVLAGMSERRLNRLLDPKLNGGLPPFLSTDRPGDVGLMLTQYTAASLLADIRSGGFSSLHSVPTSGDQEDYVSMSMNAGLRVMEALDKALWVVSAELLAAGRALKSRDPERLSHLASRYLSLVEDDLYVDTPGESVRRIRDKLYEIYGLHRLEALE